MAAIAKTLNNILTWVWWWSSPQRGSTYEVRWWYWWWYLSVDP